MSTLVGAEFGPVLTLEGAGDGAPAFLPAAEKGDHRANPVPVVDHAPGTHVGNNNVVALTDLTGNLLESYEYTSFGKLSVFDSQHSPLNSQPRSSFTFTGREFDSETGLYFYRARYYDPATGRFLNEDPIGFLGGDVNFYALTFDNPLNWTDPFGLDPSSTLGGNDPGFLDPQAAIRRLRQNLQNRNLSASERSQIQRRIQELSRRRSSRGHQIGRGLRRGGGIAGLLIALASLQAQASDCDARIGQLREEIDRYLAARASGDNAALLTSAAGIGDLAGEIFGSTEAGGYVALELSQ